VTTAAPWPALRGQSVTVGAQDEMVTTVVEYTVAVE
jgi:hypothetical protein